MTTKREFQPLTLPKMTWNQAAMSSTYGELVAQPLEPGFGFTLGGALRRALLAGVEGSAVTAVIIKGVNNEFSVLPGVVEDTMQIVLNCKEIIIRNHTGQPGKMTLSVTGEAIARVADIQADAHLELLNKDHVIAHVAQGGKLEMEFFVASGRGYWPAQWPLGTALQEDNRIYLDALFSPVRKVTYTVEKTRVGRDIDYDKLTLAITTDGTQTPVEVLHYAVSIVRTQLEHFLASPEVPFNEISQSKTDGADPADGSHELKYKGVAVDMLFKPIDILEFPARAHNCLVKAGITRIIDLVNLSEDEALKIKNFGRKSFEEVKEAMKSFGLSFGMPIKEADIKKLYSKEVHHEASER
jgi:DNA-directed RNA polymerase subunit alpha